MYQHFNKIPIRKVFLPSSRLKTDDDDESSSNIIFKEEHVDLVKKRVTSTSVEIVSKEKFDPMTGGRLDLDKLLYYTNTVSKGVQHKVLKVFLPTIKDWRNVLDTNTNQNYRKFIKLVKKLNLCTSEMTVCLEKTYIKEKFQAQNEEFSSQGWNPFDFVGRVKQLVNVDIPVIKKTCETINSATDTFESVMAGLKTAYAGYSLDSTFLLQLNKVYLFVSVVYQKCSWDIVLSAFTNMTAGLVPAVIVEKLLKVLQQFSNSAFENILGFCSQSSDTDNNNGFIKAMFEAICQTMFGMFGTLTKEECANFHINVKKITSLTALLKGCSSLIEYFGILIDFALQIIIKFVTKKISIVPKYMQPDGLKEIYDDLDNIEKDNIIEKSKISYQAAKIITDFRNKVNDYLKTGKDRAVNKLVMIHLNYIKRECENWYKEIPPYLKDIPGSDRTRPAWIYIFGAPRIGKSSIIAKTLVYACARKMKILDKEEKWDAFVFSRNLGAPYWDGYNGHPVVSYTDILQEQKDEQKLDLAITELTRINDSNAYGLEMAFDGPKGKGKNFFTSKLIVSDAQDNMNNPAFSERCWSQGTHIFARRTVVVEVQLNPKYYKGGVTSLEQFKKAGLGIDYDRFEAEYAAGNYIYTRDNPIAPRAQ